MKRILLSAALAVAVATVNAQELTGPPANPKLK
jgi:hypothetical protein